MKELSVPAASTPQPSPSFGKACRFWLKLGFISFGGPAGQIAIMHEELVERRRWISEERFVHALNYCMLLPGPEAQQLATYAGWLLHGTRGGLVAGTLFVLPAAVILWAMSWAYVIYGQLPWVGGMFSGLKLVVIAIAAAAAVRLGKKVLHNRAMAGVAVAAFVSIAFFHVPFPLLIFAAAGFGWIGAHFFPATFTVIRGEESRSASASNFIQPSGPAMLARGIKIAGIGGLLWMLPLLGVGFWQGWKETLFQQGLFFSKTAVVSFGGAYSVLTYVSQHYVDRIGSLTPNQMLDGLGLAETTPGPLIMVLQFVGFLSAWQHPGGLSPLCAATVGAALTTWVTFVPSFIWIFLGAPYVERLRNHLPLAGALSAITAAVVGVIAHLAVQLGSKVFWAEATGFNFLGVPLAALAFVGLTRWKWGVIPLILAGVLFGISRSLLRW